MACYGDSFTFTIIIKEERLSRCTFLFGPNVALNFVLSFLESISLSVLPNNLREFSLFCACPTNKHCPSARCA
jgi:hypothetical protein